MLLLLRFTGHKKLATVLGVLTSIAGLTLAVLTHNHTWLITALIGLGLSVLQLRHQHREATNAGTTPRPEPGRLSGVGGIIQLSASVRRRAC